MNNEIDNSELLIQIKKEINELENEIKNVDRNRRKVKLLRFFQYILKTGRLIAPYIVAAGITLGTFTFSGKTPFYRDSQKKYLEKMKEIDSFGNIRYEQQYNEYTDCINIVNYYSKWEQMDDGLYFRNIEQYSVKDIDEDLIINLLNNNDNISLQDILGDPISKKTELKNNLTEEEINNGSFLQYVVYSKDKHNYISVQESVEDNVGWTICYLVVLVCSGFLIMEFRKNFFEFNYKTAYLDIKEKYPFANVEVLKKKIKIKKLNYERLTGENNE